MRGEPCVRCQSPKGVRRAAWHGHGQRGMEPKLGEEDSLMVGQLDRRSQSLGEMVGMNRGDFTYRRVDK